MFTEMALNVVSLLERSFFSYSQRKCPFNADTKFIYALEASSLFFLNTINNHISHHKFCIFAVLAQVCD